MKTLDRSKPFGTVHGVHAAAYEQEGVMFGSDGKEIGAEKVLPAAAAANVGGEALHTIYPPNRTAIVLDGMDQAKLHMLAGELAVKVHQQAGVKKVVEALEKAFPKPAAGDEQVDTQLNA